LHDSDGAARDHGEWCNNECDGEEIDRGSNDVQFSDLNSQKTTERTHFTGDAPLDAWKYTGLNNSISTNSCNDGKMMDAQIKEQT
jgi:hypothetical protein